MQTRLTSSVNVMNVAATLSCTVKLTSVFFVFLQRRPGRRRWAGFWLRHLSSPVLSPPPSNPGCSHYSWPRFSLANQLTAAPPLLFSIPYMPLLLNEQSRLTPSAERKPARTQEGKESAGWKEGPENRGRQERGEKEEEWQDREGGGHMESGFCIHDILVGHT